MKSIKVKVPEIKFGTHIIVGFPSESYNDFERSLQLIDEVDFDFLMVFKYSDNPIADSYNLNNKISEKEINNRFKILTDRFNGRRSSLDKNL